MQREPRVSALSPLRKFVYAIGDHSINIALSTLSLVYFTFLITVAGLEPWLAGVIAWLARLIDAVSDPLMGRISDRTRWKMGRRRPFFLLGMLPLGLFFSLIWTTPFSSQIEMFFWYLSVYVSLSLSITVLSIPYLALIPEMSMNYDERTSINTYRAIAAITGPMVAAAFFGIAQALGGESRGFALTGVVIGVWMILPWPLVYMASFERKTAPQTTTQTHLFADIREILKNRTYLRLCGLFIGGRISMDLLGLAVPLYITVWLARPEDVTWTLLSMLSCAVLFMPIWMMLSKRFEKNQIFILGSVWFSLSLVLVLVVSPSWPTWYIFAIAGFLGFGYAAIDLMPWSMVGEVIDEDALTHGIRREGLYNGVLTFLRKVAGATAYMFAGIGLSLSGFDQTLSEQPASALWTIRGLASIAPALFVILGLFAALAYPLTRARHEEIIDGLTEREGRA
ncbi:MAG: MFS transporter [Myxococcota bacterium]|nr:MFS transporter [Myxococcota bacterium]